MGEADSPGWQLGTLRGVPVYLGRTWPIIAVVIVLTFGPQVAGAYPELGAGAYVVAVLYALLLLLSVVAHEAAHALVGQWRGFGVRRIVADLWGGHTAYESDDRSPLSSALVAVVGPLANGLLAGAGWLALQGVPQEHYVARLLLGAFVYTNAFVAIFNLLPGMPLDGGFILDAVVWRLTGSRSAGLLVAGWCGRILVALLIGWAVVLPLLQHRTPDAFYVLWSLLICGFLWLGAGNAIARASADRLYSRVRLRDVLRPAQVVAEDAAASALPHGVDLVVVDRRGMPWGAIAAQDLAGARLQTGDHVRAAALARVQPTGWVTPVRSLDEDVAALVHSAQQIGGTVQELLVLHDDRVAGLVSIGALGAALATAERGPRRTGDLTGHPGRT